MESIIFNVVAVSLKTKVKFIAKALGDAVGKIVVKDILRVKLETTGGVKVQTTFILNERKYEFSMGMALIVGNKQDCDKLAHELCAKEAKYLTSGMHVISITDAIEDPVRVLSKLNSVQSIAYEHVSGAFSYVIELILEERREPAFRANRLADDEPIVHAPAAPAAPAPTPTVRRPASASPTLPTARARTRARTRRIEKQPEEYTGYLPEDPVELQKLLVSAFHFVLDRVPDLNEADILKRYFRAFGVNKMVSGLPPIPGCFHAFIDKSVIVPTVNFITVDYRVYTCWTYCPREVLKRFRGMPWYPAICQACEDHEGARGDIYL